MINIYGAPNCNFCVQAKKLAELYGLQYSYIDITESPTVSKMFKEMFPDARTVPQIVWAGKHVGGFTEFQRELENTRNYGNEPL